MYLHGFNDFRIFKVISSVISMLVKNGSFTCFSSNGNDRGWKDGVSFMVANKDK